VTALPFELFERRSVFSFCECSTSNSSSPAVMPNLAKSQGSAPSVLVQLPAQAIGVAPVVAHDPIQQNAHAFASVSESDLSKSAKRVRKRSGGSNPLKRKHPTNVVDNVSRNIALQIQIFIEGHLKHKISHFFA
jgi:hypothetical protein